ncbi:uncharacterized protein RAG0_06608 [Rhynchosporium agropyri]|uniref:Uncharacterized protein n=3 Tax=Rhynchosporium TaxID=38037 RepID=A0A1E1M7E1_RHYSE|nr:uncharacterized protein RAG0_06608 [Rhynchosporium agropyri]CZT11606.1 uncharacterized protein RCO7_15145 [Rhynchosporium commune]CZT44575.1 uncharacterized protein RSE6_04766 [Rhynchosporium secalis]
MPYSAEYALLIDEHKNITDPSSQDMPLTPPATATPIRRKI